MVSAMMVGHPHKKGMIEEIAARYATLILGLGKLEPGVLSTDELPPGQRWEPIEWKL